MDAVVINGKLDLTLTDLPTPDPGPDQVRLRVAYVGICGSDLHYYFEGANGSFTVREPLVPGHEMSGHIDFDPQGTWETGTPVTVHPARFGQPRAGLTDQPHLWPGGSYLGSASTTPHTQGAMSEYLIVQRDTVHALPPTLPVLRAVLAEPLAVALHAATRAGDLTGARVLVSGAGPIGLLTAAAARARGASHVTITDVLPEPLQRAQAIGVNTVVQVGQQPLPAESFDVVLECSGVAPAITAAITAVRRRGTVVQVGMVPDEPRPVNLAPLIAKEASLVGVFRFKDELAEALQLLATEPHLEQVITHLLPAEEAERGFTVAKDSSASGKVVIAMNAPTP